MFNEGSWWEPPPHSLFNNGMPPQLYNTAYVPKSKRQAERVLQNFIKQNNVTKFLRFQI